MDSASHLIISLDAERDEASFIDRPSRVPHDFPCVIVRIGDVATVAAMWRRIAGTKQAPPGVDQLFEQAIDRFPRSDIARQTEGARRDQARRQGRSQVAIDPEPDNIWGWPR